MAVCELGERAYDVRGYRVQADERPQVQRNAHDMWRVKRLRVVDKRLSNIHEPDGRRGERGGGG